MTIRMLETYQTISKEGRFELEERKSRFIAICRPLETEDEAMAFVSDTRRAFPDASHHVYAWVLGQDRNLQRFTDDGEPQGTAGLPVLEALRQRAIIQGGVVVTRYFGGTLLGTGGLSRCYRQAAAQAVEAAGPVTMQLCEIYRLTIGYDGLDRLRRQFSMLGAIEEESRYGSDVELKVAIAREQGNNLRLACAEASGGKVLPDILGLAYRPLPPPDPPNPRHPGH